MTSVATVGNTRPIPTPARSAPFADRVSAVCSAMCAALIALTWRSEPAAGIWLLGCVAAWFGLGRLVGLGRARPPSPPALSIC